MNRLKLPALLCLMLTLAACTDKNPDGMLTVTQVAAFDDCKVYEIHFSGNYQWITHCETGSVSMTMP